MRPPRDRRLGGRGVPPDRQDARRVAGPRALSTSGSSRITRVYETVLYASDLAAAVRFYTDVLGLDLLEEPDELAAAFRLEDGGVLLVFDPTRASAPDRRVPSHGVAGSGHIAFAVDGGLEAWADEFLRRHVDVEREITWDEGGRSLYVRDPAGNSVELVEGEAWPPSPPPATV